MTINTKYKHAHWRQYTSVSLLALTLALGACQTDKSTEIGRSIPKAEGVTTAQALMNAGQTAELRGQYADAAALYRSAHKADPKNATPLVALGKALASGGAVGEAAEAFRQALRIEQKNPEALRGLANVLVALNQPELAIPYYQRALEIDGSNYKNFLGLGVAYDITSDHEAARAMYEAGLSKSPNNPDILANMGLSYALTSEFDKAIPSALAASNHLDATFHHRLTLALVYGLAGQNDEARQVLSQDFDSLATEQNISYFRNLRALSEPAEKLRAIHAYYTTAGT